VIIVTGAGTLSRAPAREAQAPALSPRLIGTAVMGRSLLRRDEQTAADIFAAHGYRTGIFGKWHLGDNYPYRPQDRGFQEVLTFGGGAISNTPDYWGNNYFDDTLRHNGQLKKYKGYCTDVFFNAALEFIERNKDGPFFCYPHLMYRRGISAPATKLSFPILHI
jgi:arylsulfatase A-like enzyme